MKTRMDKEKAIEYLRMKRDFFRGWSDADLDPNNRDVLALGQLVISETEQHLANHEVEDPTVTLGMELIDLIEKTFEKSTQYLLRTGRRTYNDRRATKAPGSNLLKHDREFRPLITTERTDEDTPR